MSEIDIAAALDSLQTVRLTDEPPVLETVLSAIPEDLAVDQPEFMRAAKDLGYNIRMGTLAWMSLVRAHEVREGARLMPSPPGTDGYWDELRNMQKPFPLIFNNQVDVAENRIRGLDNLGGLRVDSLARYVAFLDKYIKAQGEQKAMQQFAADNFGPVSLKISRKVLQNALVQS